MPRFLRVERAQAASSGHISEILPPTQGGGSSPGGGRGGSGRWREGDEGSQKESTSYCAAWAGSEWKPEACLCWSRPGAWDRTGSGKERQIRGTESRAAIHRGGPGPEKLLGSGRDPEDPTELPEGDLPGVLEETDRIVKSTCIGKARSLPSLAHPHSLAQNLWEVLGNFLRS